MRKLNKKDFVKLLGKSSIDVNSKGRIQTTYDVVESNKYQEGRNK